MCGALFPVFTSYTASAPAPQTNVAYGYRWPSGLEGAIAKNGQQAQMLPTTGLSIVTGLESKLLWSTKESSPPPDAFDIDGLYSLLQKGASSPVVYQSSGEAKTVVGNHAFGVIGASEEGGKRR